MNTKIQNLFKMVVTLQPFFISFIKNNYSPPNVFSNFQTCELANLRSYEVQITQYPLTLCIHAPSQQQGASKLQARKQHPLSLCTHLSLTSNITHPNSKPLHMITQPIPHSQSISTPQNIPNTHNKHSTITHNTPQNQPHHPTINPTTTQNPTTKPLLISKIKKY